MRHKNYYPDPDANALPHNTWPQFTMQYSERKAGGAAGCADWKGGSGVEFSSPLILNPITSILMDGKQWWCKRALHQAERWPGRCYPSGGMIADYRVCEDSPAAGHSDSLLRWRFSACHVWILLSQLFSSGPIIRYLRNFDRQVSSATVLVAAVSNFCRKLFRTLRVEFAPM